MPIEIKELHIRFTVNTPDSSGNPAQPQKASSSGGGSAADNEAIVAACIEQVLQILQDKKER